MSKVRKKKNLRKVFGPQFREDDKDFFVYRNHKIPILKKTKFLQQLNEKVDRFSLVVFFRDFFDGVRSHNVGKAIDIFTKKDYVVLRNLGISDLSSQLQLVSILKKYGFSIKEFFVIILYLVFSENDEFFKLVENIVKGLENTGIGKSSTENKKQLIENCLLFFIEKRNKFLNFYYNYDM